MQQFKNKKTKRGFNCKRGTMKKQSQQKNKKSLKKEVMKCLLCLLFHLLGVVFNLISCLDDLIWSTVQLVWDDLLKVLKHIKKAGTSVTPECMF